MIKKALVTGSTGFVGSNLVRKLIKGGWQVSIIVRSSSDLSILEDNQEKVQVFVYDGRIESLENAVAIFKPDMVFHVASLFLSSHTGKQVGSLIQSNILFGTQLLEVMVKHDIFNFINTSTSWEHYEKQDYSPVNLYAATKRAFQDIIQFYIEARGIRAITLKLFDTYGPNDHRPKLLNLLMGLAESGETLAMSPGEQNIDLVHIDDVVSAYCIAAKRLLDGKVQDHEIYGVGTGNPISLKELVALIESGTGKKLNIKWGKRKYREREVMHTWVDYKRVPGWRTTQALLSNSEIKNEI